MKNWKRWMYYDQTGIMWVNQSPNMQTLNGAILYPGLGIGETTNISCGRGMDRPFEMYGAPFIDSNKVVANLKKRNIPGIRFVPFSFKPSARYHKFQGKECHGVFAVITNRDKLNSLTAGLHMMQAFYECHPDEYHALNGFPRQCGDPNAWKELTEEHMTPEQVVATWQLALKKFMKVRAKDTVNSASESSISLNMNCE